jgi:hypothetical protein
VFLVISQGNVPIKITNNSFYTNMIIKEVFYMPGLKTILISSKELINKGRVIIFKAQKIIISYPKLGLDITIN